MSALVDLVEVGEGGVRLLDPAARGPEDLAGESREADGERDLRRSLAEYFYIYFMDQRRGLQRVIRPFPAKLVIWPVTASTLFTR